MDSDRIGSAWWDFDFCFGNFQYGNYWKIFGHNMDFGHSAAYQHK